MSVNIHTVKSRFGIVGHAPRLTSAIDVAIQVAPTDVTVLVDGENGTGKDFFSRIIHQYSKRKHKPFMAINCGAIPEGTMDSELFGHEKGSFTSAYGDRKGYFEEVDGGTIFLDEIGEMPMATQSRLLRLLENGEYLRVGSSKIQKADVRIIAATNKNLIEQIRRGKFREDLYFRLNTVSINVPPLRERGTDIELLFRYFSDEFSTKYNRAPFALTDAAAEIIYQYRWPGNIRELRNFAEKLAVLVPDTLITEEILKEHLNIRESYLPSLVPKSGEGGAPARENAKEIDILYKLIFDLRKEMSEMKKMLFMGMKGGGSPSEEEEYVVERRNLGSHEHIDEEEDFRIEHSGGHEIKKMPALEQSLSLEKQEKDLISKALDKYNNNRKKAARELGISERTLYRKIKQYEIN